MSGPRGQFERMEDQLERDLDAGLISQAEFNAEMREMQRDYQAAAEEAARDAYDRELGYW